MADEGAGPRIETLILANHAEAINGLLYISGGCWTSHWRPAPKQGQRVANSHFGIAIGILVGWGDTNRPLELTIRIEPEDGGDPVIQVGGNMEVGRPPGVPPGSDQRAVLAINADVNFVRSGGYRLQATLNTGDTRSVSFQVLDAPRPKA